MCTILHYYNVKADMPDSTRVSECFSHLIKSPYFRFVYFFSKPPKYKKSSSVQFLECLMQSQKPGIDRKEEISAWRLRSSFLHILLHKNKHFSPPFFHSFFSFSFFQSLFFSNMTRRLRPVTDCVCSCAPQQQIDSGDKNTTDASG